MENAAVTGHVQILVDHLHAAGGSLSLEDGQLFVEAPAPLPDGLVDRLRAAKPELIAVLAADAGWDAETANLIAWFLGTLASAIKEGSSRSPVRPGPITCIMGCG